MRQQLSKPPIETALMQDDAPKPFSFAWVQWWNRIVQLFQQSFRTGVSITSSYTAQQGDVIFADTTQGDIYVLFPLSANSQNAEITAVKVSPDANNLFVQSATGDLIQGAATQQTNTQWTVLRYGADGTINWYPV